MDWPTAAVVTSACIGAGSTLTAAILKFGPSRNGPGSASGSVRNSSHVVSERVCKSRHETVAAEFETLKTVMDGMEENITLQITGISNDIEEIKEALKK